MSRMLTGQGELLQAEWDRQDYEQTRRDRKVAKGSESTVLTEKCKHCDGNGVFGAGKMIGPGDYERTRKCEVCEGEGILPVVCACCNIQATMGTVEDGFTDGDTWTCQACVAEHKAEFDAEVGP
jgi:DnaJ-class molecular chaperone